MEWFFVCGPILLFNASAFTGAIFLLVLVTTGRTCNSFRHICLFNYMLIIRPTQAISIPLIPLHQLYICTNSGILLPTTESTYIDVPYSRFVQFILGL
jgi:hypothetical protein